MKRIISYLLTAFTIVLAYSCDEAEKETGPQIVTLGAVQGEDHSVTLTGKVSGLDAVAWDFECGIECSANTSFNNDSTRRIKADVNDPENEYTVVLSPLVSGRTYYYRAYYVNQLLCHYGETKEFTFTWDSIPDPISYEQLKEREAAQINKWISDHNIIVRAPVSLLQDSTSNVDNNEYVLFEDTGVLMQIVKRGDGEAIEKDETRYMSARFVEVYVGSGDTLTMNYYQQEPDYFYVKRTDDTYTASFSSGVMSITYGISVPKAWLMVMPYIKPGTLNINSAKVRLIVPHTQGTQKAAIEVYPTFYEITITSQRW